ncbi:hypothetical protein WCX18_04080 [Sulfurimonas sp. HSL1-2]|uniref:hypothetical protein n=1 Tax=Thiomicrolovo zhangzhouensis TaxID=3131933 RepID=UPI0031F9441F
MQYNIPNALRGDDTMAVRFSFKHFLFNAFRELFLYHHSSLEFRAKLFAALISADNEANECEFDVVKEAGMKIYNDEDRSNTLVLTTREMVEKVLKNNGLDIDALVEDIIRDLRSVPRYALKIDLAQLEPLLACQDDPDITAYQQSILRLFGELRSEFVAAREGDQPL